jgi:predicted metal-dependent hydrolase
MVEYLEIEGIGRVRVSRRRGARSIRLSVAQHGEIRLSVPYRLSLREGLKFLEQKRAWLQKHRTEEVYLDSGARIGKAHTLLVMPTKSSKTSVKISSDTITVRIPEDMDAEAVQKKLSAAANRVLKKEAESLLPRQLLHYAKTYGYQVRSVGVKALKSRWGSCSSRGDIILNSYLMQLPWPLIDYVLIHELAHLRHHNHSEAFWNDVERILPAYKQRRKALKKYPTAVFDAREAERFAT